MVFKASVGDVMFKIVSILGDGFLGKGSFGEGFLGEGFFGEGFLGDTRSSLLRLISMNGRIFGGPIAMG